MNKNYRKWFTTATDRKIFFTTLLVALITLGVKSITVLKELIVAAQLGTCDALDAFLLAFVTLSFVIQVFAGSFHSALLPTYIQVQRENGQIAAQVLVASTLSLAIVFFSAVVVLLILLAPCIISFLGAGFHLEKWKLTCRIFYFLLPIVLIGGISQLCVCVLNASEDFTWPALTPVCIPGFCILLLLFANTLGIYAIVLGTLTGMLLELGILICCMAKHGVSLKLQWWDKNPALMQVISQYLPMVAGTFAASGAVVVDNAMAALLAPGSVATLNYGNKTVAMVVGISATAVGTAIFPHFASMVASRDWAAIHHTIKKYVLLTLAWTIPLTLLLVYFSKPLVRLLFERGSFTATDTLTVSNVQSYYALQIPFYILNVLFVRIISSMKGNRSLMWIAILGFILNILFNWFFMQCMGVAGIALSTALVYFISCCYASGILFFQLRTKSR